MNTTENWLPEGWVVLNEVTCPVCGLPVRNSITVAIRVSASRGITFFDEMCQCGKKYTLRTAFSKSFEETFATDIIETPQDPVDDITNLLESE